MLQVDALFGMWTAALAQGSAGTSAAFHAALQLLSSQQPTQSTLASESATHLICTAPFAFPLFSTRGLCRQIEQQIRMRFRAGPSGAHHTLVERASLQHSIWAVWFCSILALEG